MVGIPRYRTHSSRMRISFWKDSVRPALMNKCSKPLLKYLYEFDSHWTQPGWHTQLFTVICAVPSYCFGCAWAYETRCFSQLFLILSQVLPKSESLYALKTSPLTSVISDPKLPSELTLKIQWIKWFSTLARSKSCHRSTRPRLAGDLLTNHTCCIVQRRKLQWGCWFRIW